ncbi:MULTISPECIES: aldo/keto reductase [unclassified Thermotoga]|uniref:aldo/keto reductase n=1 Tax=unclassified Thermotoga TaxID=2631113 RepID=UPI000280E8F9|nr:MULTISPECIES: aldo/keto reductase [unclassified Thermotoga]AIY87145.1 aldo/keto reductase [Thermotoga sp. 2812B]EJX25232.1 aldo/keto reductase [Thermotoga sp. EMP]
MQYREFGRTGVKTSLLGFGAMRLPVIGEDHSNIDEEKAIEMIRYAIDHGVNYVDTAYPYHGGNSEKVVGKALKDGYREKVFLATKSPVWQVEKHEDFERILDEQLEKLQTDHVDMYLMHALNKERWEKIKNLRFSDFFEKAKAKGKIRFAGFSFHDSYPVFKEIVDGYDWDFCQIQLNYMDVNYQAGLRGLKYAGSKGLAVVIMEPLKGGKLARLPEKVMEILRKYNKNWSPVELSFRWIGHHPEVSTILSGMSTLEQVKQNIDIMSKITPGNLTDEDMKMIEEIRKTLESFAVINCTQCGYCMPCPNGVDIPRNFRLYNETVMFEDWEGGRKTYKWLESQKSAASFCVECGECLSKCPQKLDIPNLLKKVHRELAEVK